MELRICTPAQVQCDTPFHLYQWDPWNQGYNRSYYVQSISTFSNCTYVVDDPINLSDHEPICARLSCSLEVTPPRTLTTSKVSSRTGQS